MIFRVLADIVVVVHFGFILIVILGGLLVLRWPRFAWVHLPAVAWAVYVAIAGRLCPLTPLENDLRARAGGLGYEGGFIEHYLLAMIYPAGLTRTHQFAMAAAVLILNIGVYWQWWRVHKRKRSTVR